MAAREDARQEARVLGAVTLGATLATALAALAALASSRRPASTPTSAPAPRAARRAPAGRRGHGAPLGRAPAAVIDAPAVSNAPQARQLYVSAAMLAASVLSDSAVEHYRGQFRNPGMFAPLVSAAAVLACALRATGDVRHTSQASHTNGTSGSSGSSRAGRAGERRALADADAARTAGSPVRAVSGRWSFLPYAGACAAGAAGLGFHGYNVLRRPGGPNWANLFYAAPLGAPAALGLAGLIGLAAGRVARGAPTLAGLESGRALGLLAAFGLAGTSVEAALLHFRGAYHHPAMWAPVSLPPVAAALLARAALAPKAAVAPAQPWAQGRGTPRNLGSCLRRNDGFASCQLRNDGSASCARLARACLSACTWLGLAGVGFHARGIARQMGGWRNWSQNLLAGPPLPAPPSFSALALAGRAALALRARAAASGSTA